jgi:hypothetical protein
VLQWFVGLNAVRISQEFDLQMGRLTGVSGVGEVEFEGLCAKRQHRTPAVPL